jgi:two-component system, NarL family, sensor histidine kinase DegS
MGVKILAGSAWALEPVRRRGRKSVEALRLLRRRVGDRHFWITQGLIAAVTAAHYFIETTGLVGSELGFHDVPVIVYVIPIIYASLHFGFEGGVFTGIVCLLLSLPNMVFWHSHDYEWVGELAMLLVLIIAGDFLGGRAEEEVEQRRKAEKTSSRLALLNQVGETLSRNMEVEEQLPRVLDLVLSSLSLDSVWLQLEPEHAGEAQLFMRRTSSPASATEETALASPGPDLPSGALEGTVVVPLARDSGSLGLLGVIVAAGNRLTDDQAELVATIAHEIQVSVENARLYRERHESLRSYARQVTVAQEEERRRIARDLHDETVQQLIQLVRKLEHLGSISAVDLSEYVDELLSITRDALKSVRRFSRDLRPSALDDLGLVPAIEMAVEEAGGHLPGGVRFTVIGNARRIDPPVELALFRITQEALRNVEKHARATFASVELRFSDAAITLSVADDGAGFTVPKEFAGPAHNGKLGLLGMKERAELVGGSFEVSSFHGGGTRVIVHVGLNSTAPRR